ncbi:uncharacterized protein LOC116614706 [Nematostella vectensis]|uniref:uncharacterized protein LOC116614706 n=1 Tax=Nematostella vectensis TaxID=45351 RepID=UPI0020777DC5|nr:uncharacterized protein LOC116614706 [Nematostella vectensis]
MTWFTLRIPCPISGCPNNAKMIDWVCATDKTTMQVCEQGRLRCSRCFSPHEDQIVKWKFDCGDRIGPHRNKHYLYADFEGFAHAMAIGVAHLSEAGAAWVTKLVVEVERQYKP